MNEYIQEKRTMFIVIIASLFLLIVLAFFLFQKPVHEQLRAEETMVTTEQMLIDGITVQLEELANQEEENTVMLERKVPKERLIDQYLLTLQEVELISESKIQDISFTSYDGELTEEEFISGAAESGVETSEQVVEPVAVEEGAETGEPEVVEEAQLEQEQLPNGLQLLTISMQVVSPNYESYLMFLKEIEKRERITRVDSLQFTTPTEADLLFSDDPDETISFTMQVTTFYYQDK
ncbi:hypothetical protein [Alkalihalobacillus sp. LMS39]|uniref:hypothetical protein n=1 Tax=Alkalihalobacillus sp. LMS39 TaxID=2924032 RepID=UPI001FB20668|nr:hypothetical protein [Alkalihalobacillus sp. LMS39]UOE93306.1 hypothetical protein MM271_19220 [Alkalihalobacillus sp. LMS39]